MDWDLTAEERSLIRFHLACRIDDYEAEIKKHEKRGGPMKEAREGHARFARLVYTKIMPDALTGDWKLMDGTILRKENSNG